MAYVNVAEWKTEQVCEWLKGLENSVLPYVHSFMNHCVNGQQLLNLRPEDLQQLGVLKLGHQEIILEAVEYLRNFHYELDRENLQLLALRLSCQASSLHNELSRQTDSKPVTTQTLSDVASIIMAVKPLVRWFDRPPFSGQLEYNDKKAELMRLSLEMATCAQRDRFAEKPIEEIRTTCGQLAKLADYIIQDIADPMILQPASLDLATLKKKPGDELGFYILPSFHGAHQIAEIKFGSAAHQCGKMEEGDEIVQVNYQTVVGWERKNVLELFRENPAEVLLTLKRRPRHTKVYGQIYIKPYRLPSNKKTPYTTRWQHNLPSPRPELLTIPDFTMPLPKHVPKKPSPEPVNILDTVNMLDPMATDTDTDSDSEIEPPLSVRLYSSKPRNLVQRRATITGASPTTKHGIDVEQFWKELKQEHSTTFQLRDKAASCAHGLDSVSSNLRPQTCLGIEQTKRKKRTDSHLDDKKVQFQEQLSESEMSQTGAMKKINPELLVDTKNIQKNEEIICNNENNKENHYYNSQGATVINVSSDILLPLDECNNFVNDVPSISKANKKASNVRGKLDKSHSTPAYDLTDTNEITDAKLMPLKNYTDEQHNSKMKEKQIANTNFNIGTAQITKSDSMKGQSKCSNSLRETCVFGVPEKTDIVKNAIFIKIDEISCNNVEENQSNSGGFMPEVKVCNGITIERGVNVDLQNETKDVQLFNLLENCSFSRETSEEKSESTSSYAEGIRSSSSENDIISAEFGKALQSIDCSTHTKMVQKNSKFMGPRETSGSELNIESIFFSKERENKQNISHNNLNTSDNMLGHRANIIKSDVTFQGNVTQLCQYVESPKFECTKKSENKLQLARPEPPPRKYFPKTTVSEINLGNSKMFDGKEKPPVPERPDLKKGSTKFEVFNENNIKNTINQHEKCDDADNYASFIEKSMHFIDESHTMEQKVNASTESVKQLESTDNQLLDGRNYVPHEPIVDMSINANSKVTECRKGEHFRNYEFPDGSGFSKQTGEIKPKTSEKEKSFEKGVVNRAMMVARSIGLHSTLGKSCNSPRSSRKRNTLLAKKRNVSVRDMGAGDLEGWLTYRTRGAGGAWAKAWFVLKCSSLYRFKTQDSIKADCLIALTGFTVSQAPEVKSRKYAFKVYHTGTVFYFAADTEDSLIVWLDAVNKATLGADGQNRSSGLFSETDESDGEHKSKVKNVHISYTEKSFGSLKKVPQKDAGLKDHEINGASLDRKYLRFLSTRNQNLPVPTAQFRSYRRVLPTSTPNKKQDSIPNSPDLQISIAGSTFYGLSSSQSTVDMLNCSQDMGDYRRTTERSLSNRSRRPDDLQGFITLEEFMLAQQDEDQRHSRINTSISRITPLTNDHVHIQHRNFKDGNTSIDARHIPDLNIAAISNQNRSIQDVPLANTTYLCGRNIETLSHLASRSVNVDNNENKDEYIKDKFCSKCKNITHRVQWETNGNNRKKIPIASASALNNQYEISFKHNVADSARAIASCRSKYDTSLNNVKSGNLSCDCNTISHTHNTECASNCVPCISHGYPLLNNAGSLVEDLHIQSPSLIRDNGYSESSDDVTSNIATLRHTKKNSLLTRKGSFNDCPDHHTCEKRWLDSLRRNDKKNSTCEKARLKNVAQYQPPPLPNSPFEQEGMRAAFEMHLDKSEQVQKANRLKSLFTAKCPKPCTLNLSKDSQKTLLGSPRLHRALFRDKISTLHQRQSTCSGNQSPGDSGISQSQSSFSGNSQSHTLSHSFSSASSVSDWSPDTPTPSILNITKNNFGSSCQKGCSTLGRSSLAPPTLPYIPPPTSPPPDYPGLEYPPIFEPGTYSLSDASLLRNRNKSYHDNIQ